jgi:ribosomal protein S18 acetylase RimI-like enzyme
VSTSLRIGPLEPRHRHRIAEILTATAVFRDEEVAVALELFDEEDPDYRFLGAFSPGGDLLGYACYGPTPGTDRTHDLYWIAVHPGAQGTGAGTRLLAEVERRLCNDGARLLVVETSGRAEYAATRGFYAAREYAASARVRDFYAPGDDRIIFTKRLTPRYARAGAE